MAFGGAFGFIPSPLQQFANSRQVGFIFPGTVASPRRNGAIGSVEEVPSAGEIERERERVTGTEFSKPPVTPRDCRTQRLTQGPGPK